MNEIEQWLSTLRPGDNVVRMNGNYGTAIAKVERITRTRVVVGHEQFYLSGIRAGHRVGDADSWSFAILRPVTDEVLVGIEKRQLQSRLQLVKWGDVDIDTLRAVVALLPEGKK